MDDHGAVGDTKACPFCGEAIKKIAVRCKHCQADLSQAPPADFDRGLGGDDFEVRFLEFAYQTTGPLNVPAVAHALKRPTREVSERLEEMAARDVLVRDIDAEGNLFFTIPGRATARAPAHPPLSPFLHPGPLTVGAPADGGAVAAMVLNVLIPGAGSLVAGRVGVGLMQLMLWIVGVPLSLLVVGIPMALAAWVWSLVSGIQILEESRRRNSAP